MENKPKRKLMVVVGSGASVEFGLPSVSDIDHLFHLWALEEFRLAQNRCQSLYGYIRDVIDKYFSPNSLNQKGKTVNFEEVLYAILQLSAVLSDELHKFSLNSFLGLTDALPRVECFNKIQEVSGDVLRHLAATLQDKLIEELRYQCLSLETEEQINLDKLKKFLIKLTDDYDVAFISLNYDNLFLHACPNLFTGFNDGSGYFNPKSIYAREEWNLIYYIHGSVHFDMPIGNHELHTIKWNPDLTSRFEQDSLGRGFQSTVEGISMPTSVIVAGYGKSYQMQRMPFRVYYSQLDEMVENADAFLFFGYGFNDQHLNHCFKRIRKPNMPRPVVIIDWACDCTEALNDRQDLWSHNLLHTIHFPRMSTRGHSDTPMVLELKEEKLFEVSTDSALPLSVWYGGFLEACNNYDLVKFELDFGQPRQSIRKELQCTPARKNAGLRF